MRTVISKTEFKKLASTVKRHYRKQGLYKIGNTVHIPSSYYLYKITDFFSENEFSNDFLQKLSKSLNNEGIYMEGELIETNHIGEKIFGRYEMYLKLKTCISSE